MSKELLIGLGHKKKNCTIGGRSNGRSIELLSYLVEMGI